MDVKCHQLTLLLYFSVSTKLLVIDPLICDPVFKSDYMVLWLDNIDFDIFGSDYAWAVTVEQPAKIGGDEPDPPWSYHSSIRSSKCFRVSRQLSCTISWILHIFNHFFMISHSSVFPVENG